MLLAWAYAIITEDQAWFGILVPESPDLVRQLRTLLDASSAMLVH